MKKQIVVARYDNGQIVEQKKKKKKILCIPYPNNNKSIEIVCCTKIKTKGA